jgi:hypothetical protein
MTSLQELKRKYLSSELATTRLGICSIIVRRKGEIKFIGLEL